MDVVLLNAFPRLTTKKIWLHNHLWRSPLCSALPGWVYAGQHFSIDTRDHIESSLALVEGLRTVQTPPTLDQRQPRRLRAWVSVCNPALQSVRASGKKKSQPVRIGFDLLETRINVGFPSLVPEAGIEPARLAAGDFESPASTNFTTRAVCSEGADYGTGVFAV